MDRGLLPDRRQLETIERRLARGAVIAGGVFWLVAAFSGPYIYGGTSFERSMTSALLPFIATVVVLIVGWTYERLAAVLLFAATAAVFVWGVLYDWSAGVWAIMTVVLIAPMVLSAILFLLAARAEDARAEAEGAADDEPGESRR